MTGDFGAQMQYHLLKVKQMEQATFVNTASHVYESVVNGSPVTAAPGQPVDTGFLRNSWQLEFDSPESALIATDCEYAEDVELNLRGVQFRNHGPHSVALTVGGFERIVEHEAQQAAAP